VPGVHRQRNGTGLEVLTVTIGRARSMSPCSKVRAV
jgi:hypothetical protein